jgi:hypothetical protein
VWARKREVCVGVNGPTQPPHSRFANGPSWCEYIVFANNASLVCFCRPLSRGALNDCMSAPGYVFGIRTRKNPVTAQLLYYLIPCN